MEYYRSLLTGPESTLLRRLIISGFLVLVPLIAGIRYLFTSYKTKHSEWNSLTTQQSSVKNDNHTTEIVSYDEYTIEEVLSWETTENIGTLTPSESNWENIDSVVTDTMENTDEILKQESYRNDFRSTAHFLEKKHKRDEYEKKLIEGYAHDSTNQEVIIALADHYSAHEKPKKALPLLKQIIDTDPNNHKILRKMSEIYFEERNYDTAEFLINQALSLYPENPKYALTLVEIYYNTGRIDDAIDTMEKIVQRRPSRVGYREALAKLYESVKEYDLVEDCYQSILQLEPDNLEIKKNFSY